MPDRFRPDPGKRDGESNIHGSTDFAQHDGEDGPDDHRQPRALIDRRQESFVDTETHCCETRLPDGGTVKRDRAQRWTPGQLIHEP